MDTRVPPDVAANLTALKHALRDLVIAAAAAPGAIETSAESLTANVINQVEDAGVPVGGDGVFGVISRIEFRRPERFPDWLLATTSLAIPYGVDTSLYLFEKSGNGWKYALALEANGYHEISAAQGGLTYYVSPMAEGKRPYLVTAEVTPWPTSVWQILRLRVLRIGRTPDRPLVLAARALSYCLDGDSFVSIRADRFSLIYEAEAADPALGGFRGVHYLEYAVGGGGARIARETAIDPDNWVRKWAARDWAMAGKSVKSADADILRTWHTRFRAGRWSCGGPTYLSQRTAGASDELLSVSQCNKGLERNPSEYVVIAAGHGGFRIDSISATKPHFVQDTGYSVCSANGRRLLTRFPSTRRPSACPPVFRRGSPTKRNSTSRLSSMRMAASARLTCITGPLSIPRL